MHVIFAVSSLFFIIIEWNFDLSQANQAGKTVVCMQFLFKLERRSGTPPHGRTNRQSHFRTQRPGAVRRAATRRACHRAAIRRAIGGLAHARSEEHTSELQSLMRNSYAVFCLKKKK